MQLILSPKNLVIPPSPTFLLLPELISQGIEGIASAHNRLDAHVALPNLAKYINYNDLNSCCYYYQLLRRILRCNPHLTRDELEFSQLIQGSLYLKSPQWFYTLLLFRSSGKPPHQDLFLDRLLIDSLPLSPMLFIWTLPKENNINNNNTALLLEKPSEWYPALLRHPNPSSLPSPRFFLLETRHDFLLDIMERSNHTIPSTISWLIDNKLGILR